MASSTVTSSSWRSWFDVIGEGLRRRCTQSLPVAVAPPVAAAAAAAAAAVYAGVAAGPAPAGHSRQPILRLQGAPLANPLPRVPTLTLHIPPLPTLCSPSDLHMLRRSLLLLLVAATAARRLSPSPVVPASKERNNKKKVLMLISDTGGGHRASAHALEAPQCVEAVLMRVRPLARGPSSALDPWPLS